MFFKIEQRKRHRVCLPRIYPVMGYCFRFRRSPQRRLVYPNVGIRKIIGPIQKKIAKNFAEKEFCLIFALRNGDSADFEA